MPTLTALGSNQMSREYYTSTSPTRQPMLFGKKAFDPSKNDIGTYVGKDCVAQLITKLNNMWSRMHQGDEKRNTMWI